MRYNVSFTVKEGRKEIKKFECVDVDTNNIPRVELVIKKKYHPKEVNVKYVNIAKTANSEML